MADWIRRHRLPLAAFGVALAIYAAVAGNRLRRRSPDPHFVVQAAAWLRGKAEIDRWPSSADDPAMVCEVQLDDGRVVRGRWRQPDPGRDRWCWPRRQIFRVAGGEEIDGARVQRHVRTLHYVSFPSFPSVLMLPQAAIHGEIANDVGTTVFLAALVPAAFLLLLRRLREAGLSSRTPAEEAWLAAGLAFGTVLFFSAVQGRVWFTAHVVGVLLAIVYAWASIEARHPIIAGAALGLATVTRTPMLFMFPLFAFEAWRQRDRWRRGLLFAAPVLVVGAIAAWYNWIRFHELSEFGHGYLAVRQQDQIDRYGLFDLHYLKRNLVVALGLVPTVSSHSPYVKISGHGLAIWLTTPILLFLLAPPGARHRLRLPLWITVALVAGWSLLYQNSGWVQFGYRFSLDYMVFLFLLLAVSARRLGHVARALIVFGIVVNLFGALTFNRSPRHYWQAWGDYPCVLRVPWDAKRCMVRH